MAAGDDGDTSISISIIIVVVFAMAKIEPLSGMKARDGPGNG